MSFLTRIGIGSATVDLIPERTRVRPGDRVDAVLEIRGGASRQVVDDIEIALVTEYTVRTDDGGYQETCALWETEFTDGFTIEPDADRTIEAPPLQVPESTPLTMGKTRVWLQTGLDIDWALDPSDEDALDVQPGGRTQALLDALEALQFCLRSVRNEKTITDSGPHPFVQKFAYDVGGGPFDGRLDAVTVMPLQTDGRLHVSIEVDRSGIEVFDLDEQYRRTQIESDAPDEVREQVEGLLQRGLEAGR
jgi:sporulation-control protein